MTITQVRFISLSRFPELDGQDSKTIKDKLAAKCDSEKIDLDLENNMAILQKC